MEKTSLHPNRKDEKFGPTRHHPMPLRLTWNLDFYKGRDYSFLRTQALPCHTHSSFLLFLILIVPFSWPRISFHVWSSEQLQLAGQLCPPGLRFLRLLPTVGYGFFLGTQPSSPDLGGTSWPGCCFFGNGVGNREDRLTRHWVPLQATK